MNTDTAETSSNVSKEFCKLYGLEYYLLMLKRRASVCHLRYLMAEFNCTEYSEDSSIPMNYCSVEAALSIITALVDRECEEMNK